MFDLLGILFLLLSAYNLGRQIYFPLKLNALEKLFFALTLGLAGISYTYSVLGLLGWLSETTVMALLFLINIPSAWRFFQGGIYCTTRKVLNNAASWLRTTLLVQIIPHWILALVLGVMVTWNVMAALKWDYCPDAYHVMTARAYLNAGGFRCFPGLLTACYPMMSELLYLPLFCIAPDTVGSLVHSSFGIITLIGLCAFGRRFSSGRAGLLAACFFYGNQIVTRISPYSYIELNLTCYLFAVVYALTLYFESRHFFWLKLAGVFSGAAVSVKFLALPYLLPPLFLFMAYCLLLERKNPKPILRATLMAILFGTVVYLPWAVKNTLCTGNPFYPFLNAIWTASVPFQEAAVKFHRTHGWIGWDACLRPWNLIQSNFGIACLEGFIPTVLLPFVLLYGLLCHRWIRKAHFRINLLFALCGFAAMTLFGFRHRFYVVPLPASAWLCGAIFDDLLTRLKTISIGAPFIILTFSVLIFAFQFLIPFYTLSDDIWYRGSFWTLPPLLSSQRDQMGPPEWKEPRLIIKEINQLLDQNCFLLPEDISDYLSLSFKSLRIPFIPNPFLGYRYFGPTLREIAIQSLGRETVEAHPELLKQWLKNQGVTHLLIGPKAERDYPFAKKLIRRWNSVHLYELSVGRNSNNCAVN